MYRTIKAKNQESRQRDTIYRMEVDDRASFELGVSRGANICQQITRKVVRFTATILLSPFSVIFLLYFCVVKYKCVHLAHMGFVAYVAENQPTSLTKKIVFHTTAIKYLVSFP